MTGPTNDSLADDAINILLQQGLGQGLPRIAEMLLNAAVLLERAGHLQADPYECAEPATATPTALSPHAPDLHKLGFALPQVRGSSEIFLTSLLDAGSRTDRSLKAAIAELYRQGVSTRRVAPE